MLITISEIKLINLLKSTYLLKAILREIKRKSIFKQMDYGAKLFSH